jgi:hypothetical protein
MVTFYISMSGARILMAFGAGSGKYYHLSFDSFLTPFAAFSIRNKISDTARVSLFWTPRKAAES